MFSDNNNEGYLIHLATLVLTRTHQKLHIGFAIEGDSEKEGKEDELPEQVRGRIGIRSGAGLGLGAGSGSGLGLGWAVLRAVGPLFVAYQVPDADMDLC